MEVVDPNIVLALLEEALHGIAQKQWQLPLSFSLSSLLINYLRVHGSTSRGSLGAQWLLLHASLQLHCTDRARKSIGSLGQHILMKWKMIP